MWNSCPMRFASLGETLLAALVDVILGLAVVVVLVVGGTVAYLRGRGGADEEAADQNEDEDADEEDEDEDEDEDEEDSPSPRKTKGDTSFQGGLLSASQRRTQEFLQAPRVRAALWGASTGVAVANRNWRSPGFRAVGLRRVDARTRGAITDRSVLIGLLFVEARRVATRPPWFLPLQFAMAERSAIASRGRSWSQIANKVPRFPLIELRHSRPGRSQALRCRAVLPAVRDVRSRSYRFGLLGCIGVSGICRGVGSRRRLGAFWSTRACSSATGCC